MTHIAVAGSSVLSTEVPRLAARFGIESSSIGCGDQALSELEGQRPSCLFIDWTDERCQQLCSVIRAQSELRDMLIVALVDDPWSEAVKQAYAAGIDDFFPRSQAVSGAEARIAAFKQEGTVPSGMRTGRVVLADADRERRIKIARFLGRLGFDLSFAMAPDEIDTADDVNLLVLHVSMDPQQVIARVRGENRVVPCIITGTHEELSAIPAELLQLPKVGVCDLAYDQSHIVFTANSLLRQQAEFKRSSSRIRFATPVRFANMGQTLFGFSYNLSLGGLYIRTFVPPTMGTEVEIEFSPPYGRGHVVFGCRVAWRQAALVDHQSPCGFGAQFTDVPLADNAALHAGYVRLAAEESSRGGAAVLETGTFISPKQR